LTQIEARPEAPAAEGTRPWRGLSGRSILTRWSLVIAWGLLTLGFGIYEPDSFLTAGNFESIFGSQAVLVVLTLGLLVPLTAGDYDLSIGGVLSLSGMITAVLNVQHHWPVGLAALLAVGIGAGIGALNGAITLFFDIDPFIVTLGAGTLASGVTLWISASTTVSGISNSLVNSVVQTRVFDIPIEFYYGLAACVLSWVVYEFTPVGRRLLFAGRGRVVARLSGLHVARLRLGALVASATLAAIAGVLQAGTSGAADPSAGDSLLLPAFAAAFFGATAFYPGRFNPWGSFVAVYFLTTGITGLALAGVATFVQDLFYGAALITAVVLARIVRRRQPGRRS
jgi:ribose transport system permease protein